MMRKAIAGVTLGIVLAGCGDRAEDRVEKAAQPPGMERALAPAAELGANKKGLVQILFVGTMVFERKLNGGNLEKLRVYIPKVVAQPDQGIVEHDILLMEGGKAGASKVWNELRSNPAGQTWTFDFGVAAKSLTAPPKTNDLTMAPQNACEAADSRWLLKAREVHPQGQPQPIAEIKASVIVELDTGVFETCGLVCAVGGKPCRLKFGSVQPVQKVALAESMVVRQEIPHGAKVKILGTQPTIIVKETPDAGVPGYDKVYNIAILNVPQAAGRVLFTKHTKNLKAMFSNPKGDWSSATASDCTIPKERQPDCFRYFADFVPRYGGFNRPICPLIEGP